MRYKEVGGHILSNDFQGIPQHRIKHELVGSPI